jgi:long-chain fatty acid transport protein
MYVLMDERKIRSATPYRAGGDVNGTAALNGDFEMDAHVIGIELVKAF